MAERTTIPWCHHTHNAWLGCDDRDAVTGLVRPGCVNCYARNGAARRGWDIWRDSPRRPTSTAYWRAPHQWNAAALAAGERHRVFCGSYMDFAEDAQLDVLDPIRARLWSTIEATPQLDWLLLSKRFDRVFQVLPPHWQRDGLPRNVWLILSAVTQAEVDAAAKALLAIPVYTAVLGLSLEPLVEPVAVRPWLRCTACGGGRSSCKVCAGASHPRGLDWLIIGGESQSNRAFDPVWIDAVQSDIGAGDTALFVKQYGTRMARTLGLVKGDYKLEDLAHMEPRHRVRQFPTPHLLEAAA